MLLAEGLLKEGELDDVDAISAATAAHLRKHQHVGRILEDRTARYSYVRYERDAEYEAREKKRAERLDEQGPGPEHYSGPYVSYDDPSLPHLERRGKGGRNGRNPGFLDSLTVYNARGVKLGEVRHKPLPQSGETIKQMSDAEVSKEEAAAGLCSCGSKLTV